MNGSWFSPEKENGKEKEEKKAVKVMVGMKVMDDDADVPIKVFWIMEHIAYDPLFYSRDQYCSMQIRGSEPAIFKNLENTAQV